MTSVKASKAKKRYVPSHIIREILFRVPSKSLVRFRAVCKQWNDCIGEDQFVDEYRRRNAKPPYFLVCASSSGDSRKFHLYNAGCDIYTHMKTMVLSKCYGAMLPSSYGLVCLYGHSDRSIAVFNPTTEEIIALPDLREPYTPAEVIHNAGPDRYHNVLGFGFDPHSRKYKVVQLVHDARVTDSIRSCYALTVGRDESSWRAIDVFLDCEPSEVKCFGSACCADGVLCWETYPLVLGGFTRILMFDLSCEKFEMILSPSPTKLLHRHLLELQGKLSFAELDFDGESLQMDISVLKYSGCHFKWSHMYRLELTTHPIHASIFIFPLCLMHDRILLRDHGALYSYDFQEKSLEIYQGNGDETVSYWASMDRVIVYAENLVFVK